MKRQWIQYGKVSDMFPFIKISLDICIQADSKTETIPRARVSPIIERFAVEVEVRGVVSRGAWIIEWLVTLTEDIDERRMHNDERPRDMYARVASYLLSCAIFFLPWTLSKANSSRDPL